MYIPGASTVGNTQQRRLYSKLRQHLERPSRPTIAPTTLCQCESREAVQPWLFDSDELRVVEDARITYGAGSVPADVRDRSIHEDDIPHNFKFSNIWEVPRAPCRRWADKISTDGSSSGRHLAERVPVRRESGRDNGFSRRHRPRRTIVGGGSAQLSDGRSHGEMIQQWFDTSKFEYNQIGTFGNTGQNILRGPRYFNTDFGLLKVTRVTQGVELQFRAETFNLFNNVNFRLPNDNVSSAQFGRITQVVEDSQRIIQFGLKLTF